MADAQSFNASATDDQLLDEAEFARLLSCRPEALIEVVRSTRIFYVEQGGERRYPAFFADDAYQRRALYRVSRRLRGLPGGSKLQFFVCPKASLIGLTPLEALRHGLLASVLRAAEGFAER